MSDRPIIMSGPMVRAILREIERPGTGKTQTRRLLHQSMQILAREAPWEAVKGSDGVWRFLADTPDLGGRMTCGERYAVGDRLWVREVWAPLDALTHNDPGSTAVAHRGFYRADESTVDGEIARWRPSIHMPRWASRLTLIVTEVRVERLQDITTTDAMAEGIVQTWGDWRGKPPAWALREGEDGSHFYDNRTSRENFALLWNSLHGSDAWDANPWIAAITFRPVLANIDALPAKPTLAPHPTTERPTR